MSNRRSSTFIWLLLAASTGLSSALAAGTPEGQKLDLAQSTTQPADQPVASIEVWPKQMTLIGRNDAHIVLVTGVLADGSRIDLTQEAKLSAKTPGVRIDAGYVYPVSDGEQAVAIQVRGQQAQLSVNVAGQAQVPVVSFVRDIMPTISKAGCNAGTCHGSAKGKNGFKLSLRGYDAEFDHRAFIDDLSGRRFNRADPGQSLMLLKPTQGVPHEGGLVFELDSRYYRLLRDWIAQGVMSDAGKVERCDRIDVTPEAPLLPQPGLTQQLAVIAHYADGSTRDVTRDAVFSSSKPIVAEIDKSGLVQTIRSGEAAMLVRYEGRYGLSRVIVLANRPGYAWNDPPAYTYIDRLVYDKLKRIHVLPSELCDDATFMRRVSIDLIGLPPTPGEVRAFLHDPADSRLKRQRLVDQLMERPEFVDFWTLKWADLLKCNRKLVGDKGVWSYRNWIRQSVAGNKPFDKFAKELLVARGSTYDNPPANFYRVNRDPEVVMETMTQLFLGVRMMCAKCHDHPFEQWTQNAYYELSAFFSRVAIKPGPRPDEEIIYENPLGGEELHPKNNRVMNPHVPFGSPDKDLARFRRVEVLADWLTSNENPYFAQSVSNRVWSYFFGRGIIDPVDDVRTSNPSSNDALLKGLTEDFVAHGFDVRHLIRTIVSSRVYQLDVVTNEFNRDDTNFSRAEPRRLTAEQLWDSLAVATGTHQAFIGVPAPMSAAQLPDAMVGGGSFLDLFGRPPRESSCECERRSEVSFAQALNLVNGDTISKAVADSNGRVAKLIAENRSPNDMVEELYLAALARFPREPETAEGMKYIASAASKAEGAQDLLWALVNSPGFLFNR